MKKYITLILVVFIATTLSLSVRGQAPPVLESVCNFRNDSLPWSGMLLPTNCQYSSERDTAIYGAGDPVLSLHLILHIVRDDFGNGTTAGDVAAWMQLLHENFRGISAASYALAHGLTWPSYDTGIDFTYETHFTDSTALLFAPYSSLYPLSSVEPGAGPGIHVYVNMDHNMLLGLGSFIWVFGTTVNGTDQSFTHELGHRLFLMHTFPDQMYNSSYCSLKGYETLNLAVMSLKKRDSVVDQCSDTEPDYAYTGCALIGSPDCGGYALDENVRYNFMSYSGNPCEVRFTHQQNGRMRCFMQNMMTAEMAYGITATTPPIADFKPGLRDILKGSSVQFTHHTFGAVAYAWQFGDGGTSTLPDPLHLYATAGIYQVSLTVTDAAGNTNTHTQSRCIRVSSGYTLPFTTGFNAFPALTGGWSSLDSNDNLFGWRVINRIRYNPTMFVSLAPMDLGFPRTDYDACGPPAYYQNVIGHTGSPTAAMYPQSRMSNGAPEDKDVMTSPVISLGGSSNPVLRFWWSHIPSANADPYTECPVDYPGAPYVCTIPVCTNPLNPACGWPGDSYIGNRMQVMLSSDGGASWVTLWDKTGADLNTVPGEACVQFHYVPSAGSAWLQAQIDLCAYSGKSIQVKWVYFNDYASGNLFLDDISFSGSASAIAAGISSTPDYCSDSTGTVTVSFAGAGTRNLSLLREGVTVAGPVAFTGISFTWPGLISGSYVAVVTDSTGCTSLADTVLAASSITGTLGMTASQCELGNGTVTFAAAPSAATAWYFTLADSGGVFIAGPDTVGTASHTFTSLWPGTYYLLLDDNLGGCFEGSIVVPKSGMTVVNATTTAETCFGNDGSLTVTSPSGSFYYTSIYLFSGDSLTSPSGIFTGLEGGDYAVYVTDSAGTCGYDTFTVVNPGTLTGVIKSIPGNCLPSGMGEMVAYLPSPAAGSTYIYYLLSGGVVVDSSGALPTPSNYWSFSLYPGMYEMVIEGYGSVAGLCLRNTDSVSVVGSGLLSFTHSITGAKCNEASNTITLTTSYPAGTGVAFTITPVGGVPVSVIPPFTAPSTYQYTFPGLASGDYAVFASATDSFYFSHCNSDTLTIAATAPCCVGAGTDYTLQDESADSLIAHFGGAPVITGKTISVNGVLTVNTDLSLVNCILYMAPGASVNVEPGAYLSTLSSTRFVACGDTMWSGIYVQDSGFIRADLTRISEAETGIAMLGGGYYITNSRFDMNHKHIVITEPLYRHPTTSLGLQGNLLDCSFPVSMLFPHLGEVTHTGIEITNPAALALMPVVIGDSGWAPNIFRGLQRGIAATECDVQVWNNQFENIVVPPLYVWAPGISQPGRAVYAGGAAGTTGTTHYADVGLEFPGRSNTFIHCTYAFETEGRMYSAFLSNSVSDAGTACWAHGVHGTGVWAEGNQVMDARTGIRVSFCSGSEVVIRKNQVTNAIVFPKITGIMIEDAGTGSAAGSCMVTDNRIELTGNGISVQSAEKVVVTNNYIRLGSLAGSLQGGIRASGCLGIQIIANRVWGTRAEGMRGIWLQYSNESLVQCNEVQVWGSAVAIEGHNLASRLRENTFTACDTGVVYVHDGLAGRQGSPGSPGGNRWMASGWKWKIFRDENTFSISLPAADTMYVRNNAVSNPSLSNSSTAPSGPVFPVSILLTQGSNKIFCGTGTKNPAQADRHDISLLRTIGAEGLLFSANASTQTLRAEAWLYRFLRENPVQLTDGLLQNAATRIAGTALLPLHETEVNLGTRNFAAAASWLQMVSPDSDYERNTQSVLYYKMLVLQQGTALLTRADLFQLSAIAGQCPRAGGPAVYMARTLLALTDPARIWADDCAEHQTILPEALSRVLTPDWILYPNPAADKLMILHGTGGILTLTDLHGRILMDIEMPEDPNVTVMDVSTLANGLYLVMMRPDAGGMLIKKLVVQR